YQLSYSRVTAFFAIFRWRRNLHFCVVTGGALYENSMPLQPPVHHFFCVFCLNGYFLATYAAELYK
ncbi:hypothetical protein, partial [Klebsiella quasipneumoniae]|uniref:hypothetical protein n=1 Tax=Klebsiella quasipneumoniae TaxID=1463165 RepID=UPI001C658CD8